MWEPKGLPLWEIGADRLVSAHSRCSPLKRGSSLLGALILMVSIPGLHLGLDQLEDEATAYFPPVATLESSLLLILKDVVTIEDKASFIYTVSGEELAAEIANLNRGSTLPHFQAGGTTIIEGEGEAVSPIC